ncbi:MAG TPA: carboxypeptidase regulatory-like domain-containing protein, partial [Gemmatirosa sp.]
MRIKRLAFATLAATALLPGAVPARRLEAQVTTGSIAGVVTNEASQPVPGAQVQVLNRATGISRGAVTREDGRFFVAGLEVGGGYDVTVRRIGFAPVTRAGVRVSLGQSARVDLSLQSQAAQLSTVSVSAAATSAIIAPDRRDVRTTISDTAILRLPTISRNFTDFVGLTPQISTAGGGFSGGTNNRFNTVRIDGANNTDLFGLGSTGQPGGQANGRSVPLEAIKEYQVLLTPFDVRQGQFSGAVINAVTKSGTNNFDGSIIGTTRNQNFSQNVPVIRQQPFTQTNYGATIGGPIVRDKAFFFVSTEFQKQDQIATGPYLGQPAGSPTPVPVSSADLTRFQQILQGYGITNLGTPGQVSNPNPLANVFARTDFNLSGSTRLVVRYNYASAQLESFSRSATQLRFSNSGYNFQNSTNAPLVQLYSNFANGNYNELFAGLTRTRDQRIIPITAPYITVQVANPAGGTSQIVGGTENSSQGNSLAQDVYELTDNFSFSAGSHRLTLGTQNQYYKVRNLFSQNSYGNYFFGSLDSLAAGTPRTYTVGVRLGGTPDARFSTANYSGYVQDEWTLSKRVNVQYGLRLDLPAFFDRPSFNPVIDSVTAYGRETNQKPASKLLFSPRAGFNADVFGNQSLQLRGGVGLFAGLPPYVFLSNVFGNSGVDTYGNFSCSNPSAAPMFVPNAAQQPTACRTTATQNPYTINTLDPNLKLPQYLKASAGLDRAIGSGYVFTLEGLYTKAVNGLFYQNIADQTVTGVDRNGRVLYGNYSQTNGNAIPYTVEFNPNATNAFSADGRRNLIGRSYVIDATNQSGDNAYSITAGLRKRYGDRFEGSLFYTYGRTYDVQSLTSSVALSNWQYGRPTAGLLTDKTPGISNFDQPHRIVLSGTYSLPTHTDVSLVYFGQSGSPYTFTYSNFDANFDGSTNDDPIYVPKNVSDPNEIRFSAPAGPQQAANIAAQQAAFDRLINATKCLSDARGTI